LYGNFSKEPPRSVDFSLQVDGRRIYENMLVIDSDKLRSEVLCRISALAVLPSESASRLMPA
jgi:hypothetical protein